MRLWAESLVSILKPLQGGSTGFEKLSKRRLPLGNRLDERSPPRLLESIPQRNYLGSPPLFRGLPLLRSLVSLLPVAELTGRGQIRKGRETALSTRKNMVNLRRTGSAVSTNPVLSPQGHSAKGGRDSWLSQLTQSR